MDSAVEAVYRGFNDGIRYDVRDMLPSYTVDKRILCSAMPSRGLGKMEK